MEPNNSNADLFRASASSAAPPATIQAQPMASVPPAVPTPMGPTVFSVPSAADDLDIIEPQWVGAVQAAVRTYQGDPYNLNTAISMLRREYLSKRYGKDMEQAK